MAGTDEMRELLIRLYDSFNTGDPKIWRDAVAEVPQSAPELKSDAGRTGDTEGISCPVGAHEK